MQLQRRTLIVVVSAGRPLDVWATADYTHTHPWQIEGIGTFR